MSPSRTNRRGKTYRYYVSRVDQGNPAKHAKWRAPAAELEEIVTTRLAHHLGSNEHLEHAAHGLSTDQLSDFLERCHSEARDLGSDNPHEALATLKTWVDQIWIEEANIRIQLKDPSSQNARQEQPVKLTIDASIVRSGRRTRIAIPPNNPARAQLQDEALIKLIAKAWKARAAVETSNDHINDVAQSQGHDPDYFGRLVRLGYLAPDIIVAILEGNQPATLTRQRLARVGKIPLSWASQRELLGFAPAH